MSRKYATQLQLDLKPSRIHRGLLIGVCLLGIFAILLTEPLFVGFQPVMGLVLAVYMVVSWRGHRPMQLRLGEDRLWRVPTPQGVMSATLSSRSVMTPFFCVLVFTTLERRDIRVPVFVDSLDDDSFRRLRVKLRVEGFDETRDKLTP